MALQTDDSSCAAIATLLAAAALTACPASAGAPRSNPLVDFAPVPDLDGDPSTREVLNAIGRDANGQIVGAGVLESTSGAGDIGFAAFDLDFSGGGTLSPLQTPAGGNISSFSAEHISSDGGRIAGFALTDGFGLIPVIWDGPTFDPTNLATPVGTTDASIDGMSPDGSVVVGGAFGPDEAPPTLWHEGSGFVPIPLDMPEGAAFGLANDAAVMDGTTYAVGSFFDENFNEHPVVWQGDGSIADLLPLNDGKETFVGGSVNGISDDASFAVGSVTDDLSVEFPSFYADYTTMTDDSIMFEEPLPKQIESGRLNDAAIADVGTGRGVDPAAIATGSGTDATGASHALFFSRAGGLRVLADVISLELGGTIGVFTSLTDVRDLKVDTDGGLLLCGEGETPDGPRGWVCRIHPSESGGPCNPADLAEPFGVLDLADISAFVAGFVALDPASDLAPPFGVFDLSDVVAFVGAFTDGCP